MLGGCEFVPSRADAASVWSPLGRRRRRGFWQTDRRSLARVRRDAAAAIHEFAPGEDELYARRSSSSRAATGGPPFLRDGDRADEEPTVPSSGGRRSTTPGRRGRGVLRRRSRRRSQDHWECTRVRSTSGRAAVVQPERRPRALWFVVRDGDEIAAIALTRRIETEAATSARSACAATWRGRGYAKALLYRTFAEFWRRGLRAGDARRRLARIRPARRSSTRRVGMHVEAERHRLREGARVSILRARCPDCRTLTAVAVDDLYECHSCGRDVPRRARARAARVGRRRRADGRGRCAPARLPGGRGRRGGHARDADARRRVRPA